MSDGAARQVAPDAEREEAAADRGPRLRDGEPALGREGARARRRAATVSADPDGSRAADGLILPGVGAFPRAMERIRATGLDELIAERAAAGTPILGICLGLQLLFDAQRGARRRRRASACSPGEVTRARRARPQGPAHRLGAGPLGARVAPRRRDRLGDAVLPRPLLRRRGRPPRTARHRRVRRALRLRGGARQRLRRPVPPREVERRRPAPARQLRRDLREGPGRGVILYPAIDIRDGHAVRLVEGDYDRETVYDADPVDAALRFADAGVHILHVVDLDGAKAGEPVNLKTIRRIADAVAVPDPGRRRAARRRLRRQRAAGRRRTRGDRHRGDARPGVPCGDAEGARRADHRLGRRARGQGLAGGLDRDLRVEAADAVADLDRARGRPLPLHADRGRRHARRARLRAARRGRGGDRRPR